MAKPAGSRRRGARGALRRVSVVPIARRIEALEPLKALYAEISATGGLGWELPDEDVAPGLLLRWPCTYWPTISRAS
jgi:hypothetical protein